MNTTVQAAPLSAGFPRIVTLLLNIGHGIDHMFLLIFATAVASIALEFPTVSGRSRCSGWARCPPGASATCGAGAS
jgi:hypothetical protein